MFTKKIILKDQQYVVDELKTSIDFSVDGMVRIMFLYLTHRQN